MAIKSPAREGGASGDAPMQKLVEKAGEMSRLCRPSALVEYQGKILIELRVEMPSIRHHLEGVDPNIRIELSLDRLLRGATINYCGRMVRLRAAGSSGTAATTWAAACRKRTHVRSSAGKRFGGTSRRSSSTASLATRCVGRVNARLYCTGPMTAAKSKVNVGQSLKDTTERRRSAAGTGLPMRPVDQHIKNETPKRPSETGGRNGASIAKFRTRRQSHICEMPRYRAVLSDIPLLTRRDGRQDSNLGMAESTSS
jgi:hypothetical protein